MTYNEADTRASVYPKVLAEVSNRLQVDEYERTS